MTPRQTAKAEGARFYATGLACVHGHIAQRYTSSGECVVCEAARRERNTDTRKRQAADWYSQNVAAKAAQSANWYASNIHAAKAVRLAWRRKNPAACRRLGSMRRLAKQNATPSWDAELTELVEREAFDLAARREAVTGFDWDVDHMLPLRARIVSGLHVWNNLQVIPASMNGVKFNRMMWSEPGEWLRDLR